VEIEEARDSHFGVMAVQDALQAVSNQ